MGAYGTHQQGGKGGAVFYKLRNNQRSSVGSMSHEVKDLHDGVAEDLRLQTKTLDNPMDQWSYSKAPPVNLAKMATGATVISLGIGIAQYFSVTWTVQPAFVGDLTADPSTDEVPCENRNTCADCAASGTCVHCYNREETACMDGSASGPLGFIGCPDWTYGAMQCHGISAKYIGPYLTCTGAGLEYTCIKHFDVGGMCADFNAQKSSYGKGDMMCTYLTGEQQSECLSYSELCDHGGATVRIMMTFSVTCLVVTLVTGLVIVLLPYSNQLNESEQKVKELRKLYVVRTKTLAWVSGTGMTFAAICVLYAMSTWNDVDAKFAGSRQSYCPKRSACNYLGHGFFEALAIVVFTIAGAMLFCAFPTRYANQERDRWNTEQKQKWGKHGRQPKANTLVQTQHREMQRMGLDPSKSEDVEEYNDVVELRLKSNAQALKTQNDAELQQAMISSVVGAQSNGTDGATHLRHSMFGSVRATNPPPNCDDRVQWALNLQPDGDTSSDEDESYGTARRGTSSATQQQHQDSGLATHRMRFHV